MPVHEPPVEVLARLRDRARAPGRPVAACRHRTVQVSDQTRMDDSLGRRIGGLLSFRAWSNYPWLAAHGLHGFSAAHGLQGLSAAHGLHGFSAAHGLHEFSTAQGLHGFALAHGLHGLQGLQPVATTSGLCTASGLGWVSASTNGDAIPTTPVRTAAWVVVKIRLFMCISFEIWTRVFTRGRHMRSEVVFMRRPRHPRHLQRLCQTGRHPSR